MSAMSRAGNAESTLRGKAVVSQTMRDAKENICVTVHFLLKTTSNIFENSCFVTHHMIFSNFNDSLKLCHAVAEVRS